MATTEENWKVFEFAKNGHSYTIKAATAAEAREFLNAEYGVEIQNCIEIPQLEWDKPTVKIYEDNDTEKESFFISIREAFNENSAELVCTNDWSLID